jgi:heme-degrading monooxygenase HmoA
MISRHWIGIVKPDKVEEYKLYLQHSTFPSLKKISGFHNAYFMTRQVADGIEFLVVTEWESIEAIQNFAGRDFELAVVPDVAQKMMVRFDTTVRHYDL